MSELSSRPVESESTGGRPGSQQLQQQQLQRGAVCGNVGLAVGVMQTDTEVSEDGRASRLFALRRTQAPKVATYDELCKVRDSIRSDMTVAMIDIRLEVSTAVDQLKKDLQELRDAFADQTATAAADRERRSIEATAFAEGCHARLQQDLQVVATGLEARLAEGLHATELALQASRMREAVRDDAVDQRFHQMSAETAAASSVRWTTMLQLVKGLNSELRVQQEVLAKEVATNRFKVDSLTNEGFDRLHQQQVETDRAQEAKIELIKSELQGAVTALRCDFNEFTSRTDTSLVTSLKEANEHIANIRLENRHRLGWLDEQAQQTRDIVKEVESLPTRRIEWVIREASARVTDILPLTSVSSPATGGAGRRRRLESPIFEIGGVSGMRLELRRAGPTVAMGPLGEEAQSVGGGGSLTDQGSHMGGGSGDCDLLLWCEHDLRIVCRLSIGDACVQVEHSFEHNGPCVVGRLATLRSHIEPEDDKLRVALEVLEVVREVTQVPSGVTTSEEAHLAKHGTVAEAAAARRSIAAMEKQDVLTVHRYLNHRVLDLVESKVDLMRSRMVRRIEWRLDNASTLRRAFPEGECLCSTTFAAAGMEGLQMVFYPSGYLGAREGYCSFFLYCPAGSVLRCWLSIAKQKREAKLVFEKHGFYGRTNFCRFENCTEPGEEAIVLVLEIDEAQQAVTQHLAHEVSAQIASTAAQEVSSVADSSPGLPESPGPVNSEKMQVASTLTFKRTPGKQLLEDVKHLPCIWTSRPPANLAESLEGYHTFNDIRPKRSTVAPPSRDGSLPVASVGASGQTHGSVSHRGMRSGGAALPAMDRYLMYAA